MNHFADNSLCIDRTHSECSLPRLHGSDCWGQDVPPDPRYRQGRLLAGHESQLDHFANLLGLCTAIPTTGDLGAILQHCGLLHRHVHQHSHKEEEACSSQEEALWRRP